MMIVSRKFDSKINSTLTLSFQIYQISSISLKSAISPRPASWILEKSVDGEAYDVWQYFGANEVDCQKRFNISANNANYIFKHDSEVICSTQFSKLIPLENGEAHVSLLNGRPGANSSSEEFLAFAMARYVRIRLVGMHSSEHAENNVQWLVGPEAMQIRSFYSLRMIKVNGRCYCSGHAAKCLTVAEEEDEEERSDLPKCKCLHNTCGGNCEKCCPLFNQRGYAPGTALDDNRCEKCECHGHAKSCRYSAEIDERGLSMNVRGKMSGGGVCIDCEKFTTGINCEKCLANYFRPYDRPPNSETPCVPCECDGIGAAGGCDYLGGDCHCKEGYTGPKCTHCLSGYRGENCTKCSCDVRGTMPGGECESHCQCKLHVEGEHCDKCVSGFFSLNADNPEGCLKCFCSGVGTSCRSSNIEAKFVSFLKFYH
jgi:laminin, alpha 1/2